MLTKDDTLTPVQTLQVWHFHHFDSSKRYCVQRRNYFHLRLKAIKQQMIMASSLVQNELIVASLH